MARISTYALDAAINDADKLIGTDADNNNQTKNFSLLGIAEYVIDTFIDPNASDFRIPVFNQDGTRITGSIMSQDSSLSNGVAGTKITIAGNTVTTGTVQIDTLNTGFMPYNNPQGILADSIIYQDAGGNVGIGTTSPISKLDVDGNIKLDETAATIDTDKFVVLDSGVLKYRTGAEVLSDIGAGISNFSGNYNDLTNKPTIPTNNNELTNGAGYTTNTGTITGSGTTNYLPRFIGSTTLGSSMIYDDGTSVGIGTTNLSYELDVNGATVSHKFISQPQEPTMVSYIANTGNTDNRGGSGTGPASFAGGSDNAVYGWKSIANGTNNRTGSSALGGGGDNSAAFGLNNVAQNSESIALGRTNTSSGIASVAAGDTLTASGNHSFACNINNRAIGHGAIAGGFGTVASGNYSVSLGINTTATQPHAFAIGDNCHAIAARAFATGLNSEASGQNAVVHGNNNVAGGTNSFVSGANSTVIGFNSTALGNNLSVTSGAGTAVGVWNLDTGFYKFQVGVGTSDLNRKNAFSVAGTGAIIAHVLAESDSYANDAQAGAGGVPIGGLYRHGSIVQIRIT
jgi:hypothetical protein